MCNICCYLSLEVSKSVKGFASSQAWPLWKLPVFLWGNTFLSDAVKSHYGIPVLWPKLRLSTQTVLGATDLCSSQLGVLKQTKEGIWPHVKFLSFCLVQTGLLWTTSPLQVWYTVRLSSDNSWSRDTEITDIWREIWICFQINVQTWEPVGEN